MSESFRDKLRTIGARNQNYQSNHHYTLEEFGLSRQTIEKELAPILEAYGLV
jgi:omega-hydroxy-beta-dihydromenaquinone-9 sulfotransferase